MTLLELSQALEAEFPAVLDLRHAIGEVCGQFVVIDGSSHVAMVHQTARDYLLKTPDLEFSITALEAHRQLFTRSLVYLLDPHLKANLGQTAALTASSFLQYATTCWPYHLDLSRLSLPSSTSLLPLLAKFFRGSYVLTWIHALAYFDQLKILVQASEYLHAFASKKRKMHADDVPHKECIEDLELLDSWAADLLKVFAKFVRNLSQEPSAIYKLIPPFCPKESSIALGRLKFSVPNPQDCKALALSFTDNDTAVLLGGDDKTIRKLDLQNSKPGWQLVNHHLLALETPISGINANAPRYVAFSPNRSEVAVAYRGYPLSVWSMSEARPVARCRRVTDWKALTDAWAGVDRVLWHPNPRQGEFFGLYNEGCVFKWSPSEGSSQEVRVRASKFEFSPNGALFITSDITGIIKRFGLQCWEPNVLIQLTEIDERASEKESEAGSTTQTSSASEVWAETADLVTALAANSEQSLYCAGNEPVWQFIAYSEIGGEVGIFQVTKGRSRSTPFQVELVREIKSTDGVHQLLFSPDSKFFLIAGVSSEKIWDVHGGNCLENFGGVRNRTDRWFMNNPKEDPQNDQQFLDFDVSNATIRTWKGGDILRTSGSIARRPY
ncbi:hypothetical protein HO133_004125 [Letharia lupina]|uniref:GPI inositol-deacylase winged helix domain-containing protein n=1 Tax=Letharia lupina TaxID=560253 RepID=A0A8H6CAL7_9LECA|nr:uncharacterized protein HO133_004125 [Letharia lupina]KAF6219656.1 hypothetical protein HO133_004125 [Letharia lupina]